MKVNVMNQERYKRASQFFIFGIILTILAGIVTFIIHPELKNGAGDSLESTGLTKVLDYIKNNGILVPLQMFILAFIPIPFLYMANIVVTTIALGFFIGIALHLDVYQGVGLTISSLPHTFVEIFAYCLLAALLFELNRSIRMMLGNIFRKNKKETSFIQTSTETIKVYLVFVLPFIIIAAFLETYIADAIFQLF